MLSDDIMHLVMDHLDMETAVWTQHPQHPRGRAQRN
jgi:hypothetical protein